MKEMEIKQIGTKSVFKVTMYLMAAPLALFLLIGVIMIFVGAGMGEFAILGIGIGYTVIPFFLLVIYGLFGMLAAWIYNKFSDKFGGLQITVSDSQAANEQL